MSDKPTTEVKPEDEEQAVIAAIPRWCPADGSILIPGTLTAGTIVLQGWVCPECDYFEQ